MTDGRCRFPRALRVRKRAEFLRVQDGPEWRIRVPAFVVLARTAPGGSPATRVGVVASKRLGGAVCRNRAKRRLRELFRRGLADLPVGLVVVVIAQAPILKRAFAELERDFGRVARDLARPSRRPTA